MLARLDAGQFFFLPLSGPGLGCWIFFASSSPLNTVAVTATMVNNEHGTVGLHSHFKLRAILFDSLYLCF